MKTAKRATSRGGGGGNNAQCVESCKLTGYSERFLYADYDKLHWFFCRVYSVAADGLAENLLQLCRMLDDDELTECADEALRRVLAGP